MRARRDASTHGGYITVYSMLAQDVILIAQANFTVGVRGSIPESRFDSSLTTLGVPRSKFNSIHAKCSSAALDMHEFMLQCYYQIRGRSAERLQADKAMLTSTPLGGIARLSPCHVISR